MSYTKGEWTTHQNYEDRSIYVWAPGTPRIATIHLRDVSINEQKANASLVSASPELLKAAISALAILEDSHHPSADWTRGSLRSAIAKAKGE